MSRLQHAAAGLAVAALLLVSHRGAYKGFFTDDEMDNIVVTRPLGPGVFLKEFGSPRLAERNFRPAGHLFFHAMANTAGLRYGPYVGVIHFLHGLNAVLVWLLLRRMGAAPPHAWAGTLVFAFHMAVFDALWKPMYVFDVLCATFTLLTLLLYLRGWWIWALIPFWFGYKSKEVMVGLPALLLAWEFLAGERRWKRVAPFALIASSFTLQALLANAGRNNDYTVRFSLDALGSTLRYYGSAMLLVPYAGLALPLLGFVRDARVRWGLMFLFVMPGVLWFLPGRLFSAYLYVPLIGLAVAFAFLAARWRTAWIALFFLLWIPGNYLILRRERTKALDAAEQNRAYVQSVGRFLEAEGPFDAVIHDGGPAQMDHWGRVATVRWFDRRPKLLVCGAEPRESAPCLKQESLAVLGWDPVARRLSPSIRESGNGAASFLRMSGTIPVGALGAGWYERSGAYRWIAPEARAKLRRPRGAASFAVKLNVGQDQLSDQGGVELEVLVDGVSLGVRKFSRLGYCEESWSTAPGGEGEVEVVLRAGKPYRPSNGDVRILGAAVVSFGFGEGR